MASELSPNIDHRSGFVYVDASEVISGLYKFANFTRAAVKNAATQWADETQAYMRREAPWKDRKQSERVKRGVSGKNARESLKAEYIEQGVKSNSINDSLNVGVRLSHGVSYGLYLEYNGIHTQSYLKRRRPIIVPTLESKQTQKFMNKLREQFAKIAKV